MKKLMLSAVAAVLSVMAVQKVRAEAYTVSEDTKIGDGGTLIAGSDGFPYTGLAFDYTSVTGPLSFLNRVNVNSAKFTIAVPSGKTAYLVGGADNSETVSDTAKCSGILDFASNQGTTVISNGVNNVRLTLTKGTVFFEGGTHLIHAVRHGYSASATYNNATITSDGEYAIVAGGGTVVMNNCTFKKSNTSIYQGNTMDLNQGTWTQNGGEFGTGGGAYGVVYIGGKSSWSEKGANFVYNLEGNGAKFQTQQGLYLGGPVGGSGTITGGGIGTFNLKGGTVTLNSGNHYVGWAAGGTGYFNVCGGTYQMKRYSTSNGAVTMYIGSEGGDGTLSITSGTCSIQGGESESKPNNKTILSLATTETSVGRIKLDGGTLTMGAKGAYIIGGAGESSFVFNGGKLQFNYADAGTAISGLTMFAVGPNGGTIETGANNITLSQELVASGPSDAALTGAFVKSGTGTLTLAGANTYRTPTRISAGTLTVGDDATFSPNSALWADADGTVDFRNTAQTVGGLGGVGTFANVSTLTVNGDIEPAGTNSVGTLTLTVANLNSGRLVIDVDGNGACDKLVVNGNVDLSKMDLYVRGSANIEKVPATSRILTATGTISGKFRSVSHDRPGRGCAAVYGPDGVGIGLSGFVLLFQ